MWVVICYDIATSSRDGQRRLRRVARACQNFGQRVQYSVFECRLSETEWAKLRQELLSLIDVGQDALRVYFLNERDIRRVEHFGTRPPRDLDDPLIA